MDPKQLDPKLKEAYNRVMGTSIPSPTPPSPTSNPTAPEPVVPVSTPPANPIPKPTQSPMTNPVTPVAPQPAAQEPVMAVTPEPIPSQPTASVESKIPISGFVAPEQKKHGISPLIIVLGMLVFFVVYALFWVKFFGVSLPFLPQ
ncbi:MAG: hypothetical protein HYT83_03145 [Candidatus Levybacteria bacterium]|nr:hypothetical protein [Candidatus Levybacteria bacterium]